MPRIVVTVLEGLPIEKKRDLAWDIARAVVNNFKLPLEMVAKEVEYVDISRENFGPAAEWSAANPPPPIKYVLINIIKGLSLEQKRGITKQVTEAVAKHLGVPADSEAIAVEINECSGENIAHGGVLTVDMKTPPWMRDK